MGAPLSLADIGMRMADLDRAADLAVANPYRNPRPVERGALRALLQDAFDGAAARILNTIPREWRETTIQTIKETEMTSEQQAHGADEAARYDVAVVGYGPTGLVAASMLGRAGYRVMVIERWPTPYGLPRLTHIDGETARIVQASGEIQRALRSAKAVDTYHYRDAAGDLLLELNWSGRACGYPAHISIYQPDIEDAVEARAKGYPNVTVLRGWEVDTLKQDEQGVTLSAHPRRGGQDAQWTDAPVNSACATSSAPMAPTASCAARLASSAATSATTSAGSTWIPRISATWARPAPSRRSTVIRRAPTCTCLSARGAPVSSCVCCPARKRPIGNRRTPAGAGCMNAMAWGRTT